MSKDNLNSGSASSEATASPKEVDALKEQVASLEAEKEELLALNAELQEALEKSSKALKKVSYPTMKVGKDTYHIKASKFIFNGQEYTAEDLAKNHELAEKLISMESKILLKK